MTDGSGRRFRVWSWLALTTAAAVLVVWLWPREPVSTAPAPVSIEPPPQAASPQPAPVPARGPVPARVESVRGVVLGPSGAPEAGVRVVLQRVLVPWPEKRSEELESTFSATDGRFAFSTARGPDLHVLAQKAGLASVEEEAPALDPDLVVRMTQGFDLTGVVEGPAGRVADCEVILEPAAVSAERAIGTRTDARGGFALRDVRAGSARITARHPDFQPVTQLVDVGAVEVVRLRFSRERPLLLRGTVTTHGGAPIAGADVRAYPGAWNSGLFLPVMARSDERGEFTLLGLGPGNLRVEVRHRDYSTRARLVPVSADSPALALELGGRVRVRGRLVGAHAANLPVALVQIGEAAVRATSDSDGALAFGGTFSSGKAELALLDEQVCFEQTGSRRVSVEIDESEESELELAVGPASVVRGVVRDAEANALAGVRVMWREPTEGPLAPPSLVALTDAAGKFRVRGLPRMLAGPGPLGLSRFLFQRIGYANRELAFAPPAPGSSLELDPVQLERPGTISGRVTRRGRGVAGVMVFTGNVMTTMQRAVTSVDGAFILRDLPPDNYRLKVAAKTMPLWLSDQSIAVAPGSAVQGVDLELPQGRTITGRVLAPDGTPVANALLVVRGQRGAAYTGDANGEFAIEVPPQDVELQAFADVMLNHLHVNRSVSVPRDQSQVDIELPMVPWGTVVARVLGLPGRKPLAGAILRIDCLDPPSEDVATLRQRNVRARWVEMTAGELRQAHFPAGRSRLTVHGDGYLPFVRDIDVPPRGTVDLGVVLLESGAEVRGTVVDEHGHPIAGARVHVGDELDRVPPDAMTAAGFTDANGAFAVRGVGAQASALVVAAKGYAATVHELQLPRDLLRAEPLQLVLTGGAEIEVSVASDPDAREFHTVLLKKRGEVVDYGTTDETGAVRFEHRGPGSYEVEVLELPGTTQAVEVAGAQESYQVRIGRSS